MVKKKILKYSTIIIFFIFICFITFPHLFYLFSTNKIHGDLVNIVSIITYLNNTSFSQFYHLPFLYPLSYTLAKTHPLFGVAIFYKAFDVFGLTLEQSTFLYIILSLVLGAFGSFLLAKEISQNNLFSILFSVLFIIHPMKSIHFVWINFLSIFYIPFVFFFLIKYFKTNKKFFAILAAIFSLFQFFASVYSGLILWGIMIPFFIIFSLILKIIDTSRLKILVIVFFIAALFIVLAFYPFVTQNISVQKTFDKELVNPTSIFGYSKILRPFFYKNNTYLFPGFIFTIFILIPFFYKLKKYKTLIFAVLLCFILSMSILVFINLLVLDILFFLFLFFLLFLVIKSWEKLNKWERLTVLSISTYALFLIGFNHLQFGLGTNISLFEIIYFLVPVGGLKFIGRAALSILPFFIVLAAIGANIFFKNWKEYSNKKKYLIIIILLVLILFENKYKPYVFFKPNELNVAKREPNKNINSVYKLIPFKKNKIILEVPYFFAIKQRNAYYMKNWKLHQNYLLNGKISIKPVKYYNELRRIIGYYQTKLLSKPVLKHLINNYSVNYLIYHFDLIAKYLPAKLIYNKQDLIKKAKSVKNYAKIIFANDSQVLIKIQEFVPIKNIIRTYSFYHLRKNRIYFKLSQKYFGKVKLYLNYKLIENMDCNDDCILVDLRKKGLDLSKNIVQLTFERKVILKDIDIM